MKKFVKNRKNLLQNSHNIIRRTGGRVYMEISYTSDFCIFVIFLHSNSLRTYGLTTFSVNFGDETLILLLVTIKYSCVLVCVCVCV